MPQQPSASDVLAGAGPLSRRLHQRHSRLWHERVDSQITGPQFSVLAVLLAEDALALSEIIDRTHLDKSTLTPLLVRLEQRGLLTVQRDPADQRRRLASLTPEGRDTVVELTPRAAEAGRELLAPLSPAERETLLALLARAVE